MGELNAAVCAARGKRLPVSDAVSIGVLGSIVPFIMSIGTLEAVDFAKY